MGPHQCFLAASPQSPIPGRGYILQGKRCCQLRRLEAGSAPVGPFLPSTINDAYGGAFKAVEVVVMETWCMTTRRSSISFGDHKFLSRSLRGEVLGWVCDQDSGIQLIC